MSKIKKANKKSVTIIVVTLLFAVVGASLLIFTKAATGTATYSISPSTGSYNIGTDFTVSIFENSGTVPVAGADAFLTYDATKLDFVSVNTTGGVFTDCPTNSSAPNPTGGNGTVKISCIKFGSTFTGNQKIGNVTFRPKVGTGSTSITFAANSAIYDESVSNVWNGVTTGGTFTYGTTSTPPPGSGGTTTPPPTSGGGSTSTPTSGTSGGSKATPKSTTSGGSSSSPAPTSNPTTTSGTGTPTTVDTSADSTDTVATTTPQKLNTNAIVMYAAVIGGAIAVVSVSGVAFAKVQRKNKFNRAHGMGKNSAVVFDANNSVHNPQTNSIDQGPMVMPSAPAQSATPAAPIQPITHTSSPQQGSIITPDNKPPSA